MEIGTYNLDDDIINATAIDQIPRLKIYRPDSISIVIGRGSDPETELNIEACLNDGVPVIRRRGGGCAVLIDPGNVIISLSLPPSGFRKVNEHFGAISDWLISGLDLSGVKNVHREGVSDLAIGAEKIAGACMQMKREFIYYSASLLFAPDTDLMEKYLKHPPREPAYRKKRRHHEFVGSVLNLSGIPDILSFIETLSENLDIGILQPPADR